MFTMKHKIVSSNVRGLNDEKKRPRIRGLLRDWKQILFVSKRQRWRLFLGR